MEQYNICIECGFEKTCTEEEFAQHVFSHDELDMILAEMGVVQEQRNYSFTIMPSN